MMNNLKVIWISSTEALNIDIKALAGSMTVTPLKSEDMEKLDILTNENSVDVLMYSGVPTVLHLETIRGFMERHPYIPLLHVLDPEKKCGAFFNSSLMYRRISGATKSKWIMKHLRELRAMSGVLSEHDRYHRIARVMLELDDAIDTMDFTVVMSQVFRVLAVESGTQNMIWMPDSEPNEISNGDSSSFASSAMLSAHPAHISELIELRNWIEAQETKVLAGEMKPMGTFAGFTIHCMRLAKAQGTLTFLNCPDGTIGKIRTMASVLDRTLKRAREFSSMQELTYIDDLTDLYNQRYLFHILEKEIQRAQRKSGVFSLLFIDADGLKQINDSHGHLIGSQLIVEIGKIIKQSSRTTDYAFRYGGDEYILILTDSDQNAAGTVAERIRAAVESTTFVMDGLRLKLTLSIGVACYPDHAQTPQDVIAMADRAMYAGKRKSRNTVFVAS